MNGTRNGPEPPLQAAAGPPSRQFGSRLRCHQLDQGPMTPMSAHWSTTEDSRRPERLDRSSATSITNSTVSCKHSSAVARHSDDPDAVLAGLVATASPLRPGGVLPA